MKKTLATIGLLMFASATFGSDGQHTGVGGNPAIPPPNPSGIVLPPWNVQMLINPGLVIPNPVSEPKQDASHKKEASKDQGKKHSGHSGRSSAQ